MGIDQLPVEILLKIFTFLPTYGAVSLVNKLFYDIACKVNTNFCVRIDQRFIERCSTISPRGYVGFIKRFLRNKLTSSQLQASKRQIWKVEIIGCSKRFIENQTETIFSVIERFSTSIKYLKLANFSTDETTFLEILSLTPNIEELVLYDVHCITEKQPSKKQRCNKELNLRKLKLLTIRCDQEFIRIFNRLPVGILTKLHIICERVNKLDELLNQQQNIEDLRLRYYQGEEDIEINTDSIAKLKLKSLELDTVEMNSRTIAAILSKQIKLKSLVLCDETIDVFARRSNVDERVMDIVEDCLELEVLAIEVTRISLSSLIKIRKFRKLIDLTVRCGGCEEDVKFRALAESDLTSIKKLNLIWENRDPVDHIGMLAKSAPNLTHFRFVPLSPPSIGDAMMHAVLKHFNFIEVLEISNLRELSVVLSDDFNPKLRELTFFEYVDIYDLFGNLPKLFHAYPNLKKLKLTIANPQCALNVGFIFKGFTKLESLIVKSIENIIIRGLYALEQHKEKFKFLSLGGFPECLLSGSTERSLRQNFDVVVITDMNFGEVNVGTLNVAVDQYTMHCEREEDYAFSRGNNAMSRRMQRFYHKVK